MFDVYNYDGSPNPDCQPAAVGAQGNITELLPCLWRLSSSPLQFIVAAISINSLSRISFQSISKQLSRSGTIQPVTQSFAQDQPTKPINHASVALTMSLGPERDLDPEEVEQEEGFGWRILRLEHLTLLKKRRFLLASFLDSNVYPHLDCKSSPTLRPDRKSTRLNSSHGDESRMPSSA